MRVTFPFYRFIAVVAGCFCLGISFAQPAGYAPVPQGIGASYEASDRRVISWEPVAGHGDQIGLITATSYDTTGFSDAYGTDQANWTFGDGAEVRSWQQGQNTRYHSSYGFDIFFFGNGSSQGSEVSIYTVDEFGHTPIPLDPIVNGGNAKVDQIHHFNADSVPSMRDMIDLSPLGITHPDQLIWYPSENGYPYNYLLIEDNNGDSTDIAAGVNLRQSRLHGTFSLTENIIYADGQTTYHVYRRIAGEGTFTQIASGITDSLYVDEDLLQPYLS